MSALPLAVALQLAVASAPDVAPSTLLAFAQHESGLDPLAIHDNTTRHTFHPAAAVAAVARATSLLAEGHSLDLGIMQVNSANLARTGLTVSSAFDPGQSMRAGAEILVAAYQQCQRGGQVESQAALRCAASVYNTGREQAGILNGYQANVWRAAAQIVPAIQTAAATTEIASQDVVAPQPRPRPPTGLDDALHPSPLVPVDPEGVADALHLAPGKDSP